MKKGSSENLLLDVNVLLALAWPNHQFFSVARQRLQSRRTKWSTCAITQLGFIRLSANPAVVGSDKTPAEAAALLKALVADPEHIYLESLPSPIALSPALEFERILGYRQVTDLYLLHLAQTHGAILATFDSRLSELVHSSDRVEVLR